jgi:hypothetical protein
MKQETDQKLMKHLLRNTAVLVDFLVQMPLDHEDKHQRGDEHTKRVVLIKIKIHFNRLKS